MKLSAVSLAVAMLAVAGAAQAYTYGGDTTGKPTYNRAFADFSGLSGFGQNVNYDALSFTVTASGTYDFTSIADGWDNFLFLYGPSFNPAAPLTNGLIGNDDSGGIGTSAFSFALTAGSAYVLVTTGFEGGVDFGAYTNTITGPGSVVTAAVPEPETYALMVLGLAGIGAWARRRRAVAA